MLIDTKKKKKNRDGVVIANQSKHCLQFPPLFSTENVKWAYQAKNGGPVYFSLLFQKVFRLGGLWSFRMRRLSQPWWDENS
jgi:hypothetical protein